MNNLISAVNTAPSTTTAIATTLIPDIGAEPAFTLVSVMLPPYDPGAPVHMHPDHTEGCYVIAGVLALTQDTGTITLAQGTATKVQPGVAHTCWNPTATPTTILLIYTPGGSVEERIV